MNIQSFFRLTFLNHGFCYAKANQKDLGSAQVSRAFATQTWAPPKYQKEPRPHRSCLAGVVDFGVSPSPRR